MRKVKIILEGPDGAGKTTLANMFSSSYGLPTVHLTHCHEAECMSRQFHAAIDMNNVVMDRYVLSNVAYSSEFGNTELDCETREMCMQDLGEVDKTLVVICLPYKHLGMGNGAKEYTNHYKKIADTRYEMFEDCEAVCNIWRRMFAYYEIMRAEGYNVIAYDFTDSASCKECTDAVASFMKKS